MGIWTGMTNALFSGTLAVLISQLHALSHKHLHASGCLQRCLHTGLPRAAFFFLFESVFSCPCILEGTNLNTLEDIGPWTNKSESIAARVRVFWSGFLRPITDHWKLVPSIGVKNTILKNTVACHNLAQSLDKMDSRQTYIKMVHFILNNLRVTVRCVCEW